MNVATALALALSLPITLLIGVFVAEVTLGLRTARKSEPKRRARCPETTVLMPAHNEASGIAATILNLSATLPKQARLLVVADNCTDATAAIARAAGAEVIERLDGERRGKGYALAFGQAHMRAGPPECVIVFDADCRAEAEALETIARQAVATGCPVQACYLFEGDLTAPPMVQISNFAILIKNFVRQWGLQRLKAPAVLTGTGMAFPWPLFDKATLASAEIVEDLTLGIELTRAGAPPQFAGDARVWSKAASAADTLIQRTRWEHGFIATARRHGLPLLAEGLRLRSWPLFWLGAHLLVPPVALLLMLGCAQLMALAGLGFTSAGWLPASVSLAALFALLVAVMAAWAEEGRAYLAPATLRKLPLYALWKVPVYLRLFGKSEQQWIRTRRPSD